MTKRVQVYGGKIVVFKDGCSVPEPIAKLDDLCVAVVRRGTELVLHCLSVYPAHPERPRVYTAVSLILDTAQEAETVARALSDAVGNTPGRRCVFVLVNPRAGRGMASTICDSTVVPLLAAAGISSRQHVTQSSGDAAKLIAEQPSPFPFAAIVAVGGDGMLSEVVNGLLARTDRRDVASRVQLVPVAAGTGNGFAQSLYRTTDPAAAICHCIRGCAKAVDAFLVQQPGQPPRWGVLGCSVGILADADLDSERFRWLGSARFFIAGAWHVLWGPRVRCTLSFIPGCGHRVVDGGSGQCTRQCAVCATSKPHPRGVSMLPTKSSQWETMSVDASYIVFAKTRFISATLDVAPHAHVADGYFDICFAPTESMSRWGCAWTLVRGFADGSHLAGRRTVLFKARAFRLEPPAAANITVDGERIPSGAGPLTFCVHQALLRVSCFE